MPLKQENLKKLPTEKIKSRCAMAFILRFYGRKADVCHLLQRLSHASRAYIVNEKGLPGFLVEFDLIRYLKQARKAQSQAEEA